MQYYIDKTFDRLSPEAILSVNALEWSSWSWLEFIFNKICLLTRAGFFQLSLIVPGNKLAKKWNIFTSEEM